MSETAAALGALRGLHAAPSTLASDLMMFIAFAAGLASAVIMIAVRASGARGRAIRRAAAQAITRTRQLPARHRLAELAKVLRRLARTAGGENIASLRGEAWLSALDRLFGTSFFVQGEGRCFADDLYADKVCDVDEVSTRLQDLVRRLRV